MSDLVQRLRSPWHHGDCKKAADRIEHLERVLMQAREALDGAVESARLLGAAQCRKEFGCYTEQDARFETAMHQSIAKHRAAIDEALHSEVIEKR